MLNNYRTLTLLAIVASLLTACGQSGEENIPDLSGEWKGINRTISEDKGYREWKKIVTISEQKDRRFKGSFNYNEGSVNFFGVIFADNVSFAWVSKNSQGYNIGKILGNNRISSCYVEAGKEATTGCAELVRNSAP